ncbi:hypothetical protein DFH06DRAFT_1303037 [Mycena polygramma]|nr:hypothetical protein DFH06DRAFT_1303037 [Mycena polygramma]
MSGISSFFSSFLPTVHADSEEKPEDKQATETAKVEEGEGAEPKEEVEEEELEGSSPLSPVSRMGSDCLNYMRVRLRFCQFCPLRETVTPYPPWLFHLPQFFCCISSFTRPGQSFPDFPNPTPAFQLSRATCLSGSHPAFSRSWIASAAVEFNFTPRHSAFSRIGRAS